MKIISASLLLTGIFLSANQVYTQDQRIADSLSYIYYSQPAENDSLLMELLYNLSYYHPAPDSALKFSEKLIDLAEENANLRYVYRGLLQKGSALRLKGEFDEAAKTLFECASVANKMNYNRGVGCAYTALGDIYFSAEDHANSLKYYKNAIAIFGEEHDSALMANVLFNAGSEYLNIDKPDSALYYFDISEKIYNSLKNPTGMAYCIGNKGLAWSRTGRYRLAEKNLLHAISMLKDLGDMYPVASYQKGLSVIYKQTGNYTKAIDIAKKSHDLALRYGLTQQVRDACEILSELYSLTGDYKNAFEYHIAYISYRDSIINAEKILQLANMRADFEVAQKQAVVNILKRKKLIQTIVIIGLVIIVLLTGALIFILMINNRRRLQINRQLEEHKEELEAQRDRLAELNSTKDRFFSIISHDLRGPVSSLHGFSIILREYIETGRISELHDLTDDLTQSVSKVSSLLDNLLDWALSQQGRFPYSPEKLNLLSLIEETIMSSAPMALAKNINIGSDVDNNITIWADKNSVMTVFRNLLNNAVKFSHKDSNIDVLAKKEDITALVQIKDYGVGIEKEKLKDIFKLKGDKSTWGTAKEKGVGLGLSLAWDFVMMNKGTIDVQSKEGEGTTFYIQIPLVKK